MCVSGVAARPVISESATSRSAGLLAWIAFSALGAATLVMIAAALLRSAWMVPGLAMPHPGPPWGLGSVHVSAGTVTVALWLAALLAGGGIAAGLAAVRGGLTISARALPVAGLVAVAILTVLPPVGSNDVLDYAAYGEIVEVGHSPYVMTPGQLRTLYPCCRQSVPLVWEGQVTVYGPAATAEQYVAAWLGGFSVARIVFWLKAFNAIAFGVVALALQRMLRHDPAALLRAHLLWTVNPLLVWSLIAAAHVDVLAAAFGLLGVVGLSTVPGGSRMAAAGSPILTGPRRAALAGAAVGIAADVKIFYLLFGLGMAWLLRRQYRALAAAAGGMLVVLLPTYLWFGPPALQAVIARRDKSTVDNFYTFVSGSAGYVGQHLVLIAGPLTVGLAILLLRRLPAGAASPPAVAPALALSLAWLFVWPYQLAWYDTMALCLLVLYPASRLDWLVLARLTIGTLVLMPGNPGLPPGRTLAAIAHAIQVGVAPAVLLCAAAGLAVLCASGRLERRRATTAKEIRPASSKMPVRM